MKTAMYREQGSIELVLTPENSFEHEMIQTISHQGVKEISVYPGALYERRGEAIQHQEYESLILRLEEPPK